MVPSQPFRTVLLSTTVVSNPLLNRQAIAQPPPPPTSQEAPSQKPTEAAASAPISKTDDPKSMSTPTSVTPSFTPPPPIPTTCQLITTTLTYSESGVSPWPYTGCATSINAWVPNYTVASTSNSGPSSSAAAPAPTDGPPVGDPAQKGNTKVIVASTVSVACALVLVVLLGVWLCKRRRKARARNSPDSVVAVAPYFKPNSFPSSGGMELGSLKSRRMSEGLKSLSGSVSARAPLVPVVEVPLAETRGLADFEVRKEYWTPKGYRGYGDSRGGLSVRASQGSLVHPVYREVGWDHVRQ